MANERTVTDISDLKVFQNKLKAYKTAIDKDLAAYSKQVQKTTLQNYGKNARVEIDAFLSVLDRGGKRIRGALTMLGYEMQGGKDKKMIVEAARAIEMLHAYILIVDDIQDRSTTRRSGPTAHVMLSDYHRQHQLADDSHHFGISLALNAALAGAHAAQIILANLGVNEELRLNALSIANRSMLVTAHGQTNDIMNEVVAEVTKADVERVLEWKTAHYTILNPIHVGMVLGGAECEDTDAITDYALQVGTAFQITDDIIGTFGTEFEVGKSPMDDIREGKRTFLTMYALEHAPSGNKNFLTHMLGNHQLSPAEFQRCKDIIVECGALEYSKKQAKIHVDKAIEALNKQAHHWSTESVQFLRGLAVYLLTRHS